MITTNGGKFPPFVVFTDMLFQSQEPDTKALHGCTLEFLAHRWICDADKRLSTLS